MSGNVDGANLMVKPDLGGAGTHINACAQTMADELASLAGKLHPVLDGTEWSGTAQQYFDGLESEWNYAANGLFGPDGVLGQIANAMQVNWNNYSEAEYSNTSTWRHS
ncbi:WXG100 family type VII secretion target [Streptomyces sp. NPDC006739]|uniref:WXG100 family type VII secretion target n=1 Tax=Streptomyces sp. NPDC006739 TaxID=3364763 RepID=UPI00367E6ADA